MKRFDVKIRYGDWSVRCSDKELAVAIGEALAMQREVARTDQLAADIVRYLLEGMDYAPTFIDEKFMETLLDAAIALDDAWDRCDADRDSTRTQEPSDV